MPGYLKRKDDRDCDKKVSCDCKTNESCDKHVKPISKPLLLFCGQGGNTEFTSPDDPPVNIGSVVVDTRTLDKPKIKIKFSSIVNFTGLAANPAALLTFRLFRVCDGGVPFPLSNWVYEAFQINEVNALLRFNTSFAFIFCERSRCPRLCEYFVEVSIDNLVNAEVAVNNVQIQSFAQ
ncbi:DUF4489 domain-containing protein [Wukongibacter baidiensis]|uniref:DUF4489 domain-containing protein n=1 Tax=Wukongibacter baidiensis TaxID=1723361 RepID=UPI003D7F9FC7